MEKGKLSSIFSTLRNEEVNGLAGIYTPVVFQALLKHERCRADRDNGEFCLVVFDISSLNDNGSAITQIVRCIKKKIRSIDEVGWLDIRRIGALLPLTNASGAEKFALRVTETFKGSFPLIPWTMYAYPAHWTPGTDHRKDAAPGQRAEGKDADCKEVPEKAGGKEYENLFADLFCRRIPAWKRCIDFVGSIILITLLSPLFLITAIYVKVVSPGPALFKQQRVGYKGRLFTFYKFRTMHVNNDVSAHREYVKQLMKSANPMEKLDQGRDPRIIPGGKLFRKSCIDELPQLFNVLFGTMSLVGPRPCIPYEAEEYLRWHRHRFDILPGMTGLWQVNGKNKLSFEEMIRLDISYADRMSLGRDIAILLRTGPAIIKMAFEAVLRKRHAAVPPVQNVFIETKPESESVQNA